jgi:hypothetical protein
MEGKGKTVPVNGIKAYVVKLHSFLTSALGGGEWSVSRQGHFTPVGKSHRYPLHRRRYGPQGQSGSSGEEENMYSDKIKL